MNPTLGKGGAKAKLSQHFLCVDFFPDGSAIVGAASGDLLHFRGRSELSNVLQGAHKGFVSCVRVMPDGVSVCTAGKDGRVVVWGHGNGSTSTLKIVLEIGLADALGHPPNVVRSYVLMMIVTACLLNEPKCAGRLRSGSMRESRGHHDCCRYLQK